MTDLKKKSGGKPGRSGRNPAWCRIEAGKIDFEKSVPTSVNIPGSLRAFLDALAQNDDLNISDVATEILSETLPTETEYVRWKNLPEDKQEILRKRRARKAASISRLGD